MHSTVTAKQAAIEAGCYTQQVYDAIGRGRMKARRVEGRVVIDRTSFQAWRRRLETRRALREESA